MAPWLVGLQLAALVALAATGPLLARAPLPLCAELAGIGLGLWAVAALGVRQLRPGPEPATEARLVVSGPYRWIRHPMYAATLLVAGAWVASAWTPLRVAIAALLAGVLAVKMRVEERLLARRFPAYPDYARRTKRLVPGVW